MAPELPSADTDEIGTLRRELDELRTELPSAEVVWFIGPWDQPGYYLRVSVKPGKSQRSRAGSPSWQGRPPRFPWRSMDRAWSATYQPQGTAAMDYGGGWSVLSVADYTVDPRPNVLVAFAVERPDVAQVEMEALAADHYPTVWARLGIQDSA